MNLIYHVLSVLTSTLFIFYGASCLWSAAMKAEFERFGLSRYRVLSGVLEILGALGLALGFFLPSLRVAAASGLALLMVLVVVRRVQQRDSFGELFPALLFAVITLWIALYGALVVLKTGA
ncbi:MAG: hypothetical protein HOC28_04960 [Bacteroidetes Order II. Incertae sedis bacterium]|jgi:uncharacterized membrane protein YphA (DoxX/SURF4 family)|nr:hypothetical protein [Bacteroidetes Order II. bacterium]MBT4051922.1 hypothetical protein [Bacteroidetes Order II. bacterium]MBT4602460.1 hypothetical protein [Bacteroidetes Order II. bacterium]MBT5249042.1 hypothetical protein [Bacteroidetes Order II. bacterium]MBT6199422.1 hypothetical protein [Bacteroidetes Order II. bacterium]